MLVISNIASEFVPPWRYDQPYTAADLSALLAEEKNGRSPETMPTLYHRTARLFVTRTNN
jgi:hypothetical protein